MPAKSNQASRQRQINSLRIYNPTCHEEQANVHYRIDFGLRTGEQCCLRVLIGYEFPAVPPRIYFEPSDRFAHPWMDQYGQITKAHFLVRYQPDSVDLGRMVLAVIKELSVRCIPIRPKGGPSGHALSTVDLTVRRLLEDKSVADLTALLRPDGGEASCDKFALLLEALRRTQEESSEISDLSSIAAMDGRMADLCDQIDQLMTDNTGQTESIDHLRRQTLVAVDKYNAVRVDLQETCSKVDRTNETVASPDFVRRTSDIAKYEAENQSDAIAKKFTSGQITLDAFMKDYLASRMLFHRRKLIHERIDAVLAGTRFQ